MIVFPLKLLTIISPWGKKWSMEKYIKVRPIYKELNLPWWWMVTDIAVLLWVSFLCSSDAPVWGQQSWVWVGGGGDMTFWFDTLWQTRACTEKGRWRKGSGLFPAAWLWSIFCKTDLSYFVLQKDDIVETATKKYNSDYVEIFVKYC